VDNFILWALKKMEKHYGVGVVAKKTADNLTKVK
jgi:hypothetical protein